MKQVKQEVQSKKTPTSFPMKKPRIRNIECNDPVVISAMVQSSKKKVPVYLLRMILHSCFVVNNDQVTIMLSEEDRSKVDIRKLTRCGIERQIPATIAKRKWRHLPTCAKKINRQQTVLIKTDFVNKTKQNCFAYADKRIIRPEITKNVTFGTINFGFDISSTFPHSILLTCNIHLVTPPNTRKISSRRVSVHIVDLSLLHCKSTPRALFRNWTVRRIEYRHC
jgi:hypothetical protein